MNAQAAREAEVLAAPPETVYARKEGEPGFNIQHGKERLSEQHGANRVVGCMKDEAA